MYLIQKNCISMYLGRKLPVICVYYLKMSKEIKAFDITVL